MTEAYIAFGLLQLEILIGNDLGSARKESRHGNLLFGKKRLLQRIDHREIGKLQEHLLSSIVYASSEGSRVKATISTV